MAIHDYRFNPFENTFDIKKIFDETHVSFLPQMQEKQYRLPITGWEH